MMQCTVKQISDNEIYLLIKYIKSVLWRVVKRLSYIQNARCLKVKCHTGELHRKNNCDNNCLRLNRIDNSICHSGGPGSVVSIATRYEMDGRRIESRCVRDYPQQSRPAVGRILSRVQWVPVHITEGRGLAFNAILI